MLARSAVTVRRLWLLPLALWILTAGSCDHTQLRGRIVANPMQARVGEAVELELEIPPELDRIHWVMWTVRPTAELEYDEVHGREFDPSFSKADRRAVFRAARPGEYLITTEGFYRQTNPQPIAEITLIVRTETR
jgi:hypothetical protein